MSELENVSNEKPPITGYRALTGDEIAVINAVKKIASMVGDMVEILKVDKAVDQRWLAVANTDLQKGFMALIRAIAKPEGF